MTEHKKTNRKSPVKMIILGAVLVIAGIIAVNKIAFALSHETTDNAQIETQITPVLPRVAGYVQNIAVNDYDSVVAGQLLLQLDDAELQAQLLQMEADLKVAEADIVNARAAFNSTNVSLDVNKGNIALNNVKVKQAEEDYIRNKNLFADQAITKKQLDDSRYAYEQALQEVQNSKNDLSSAHSKVSVMQAGIMKATAALESKKASIAQQKLKISYTKIFAPMAGKIGKRNITDGQFVQAGTPLFSIVNDTTYWIVANFKETQINKFHDGMPVKLELDAFPNLQLNGRITSLSDATGARFSILPPDNSSGNFVKVTQRVPVRISIENVHEYRKILRAGLSAYVEVKI